MGSQGPFWLPRPTDIPAEAIKVNINPAAKMEIFLIRTFLDQNYSLGGI
jgi:hypothetical protein